MTNYHISITESYRMAAALTIRTDIRYIPINGKIDEPETVEPEGTNEDDKV
jgi:hypothetical protein